MAVLLCGVVLLTTEKETPDSLISAIKSGSPSRRWQKAFELSNELNQGRQKNVRDASVLKEIIYILENSKDYDEKTRGYMAMALAHFPETDSVAALRNALKENSDEIQIAALWSLGSLGTKDAAPDVEKFLKSDKPELRKMSAYVLGVIGKKEEAPKLKPLLNDASTDVRWNTALALARLGDDAGYPVLEQMLDRSQTQTLGMEEPQIEAVMTNAIKGLALLQKAESIKILSSLSRDDKNMKVRQAAIDAMDYRKKISV